MKTTGLLTILLLLYLKVFSQAVTYYNEVEPLLQAHCTSCHNKNGVGAMPLTTYEEVSAYAKMITYVAQNRLMPPWKADPGVEEYRNHNTLSEKEIDKIKQWLETGMAKGNKPATKPKKEKLVINKPDFVFAMQQPFEVPGDYKERTQVFVVPTGLKENVFISAVEFVPGSRMTVKSCTVSIDTSGEALRFDSYDGSYGYRSFGGIGFIPGAFAWYQYTAGDEATFYSLPFVKKIPAGSKLVFHISYAASREVQKDSSFLKIKLAVPAGERREIQSKILFTVSDISNPPFVIDKDEKKFFYASKRQNQTIKIHSIMPHGQYACRSWEIFSVDSLTGIRKNILKISNWDAHWKKKYDLLAPLIINKGETIHAIAFYNNSEENPNLLILPTQKIKYGESVKEEMFLVQYDYTEM